MKKITVLSGLLLLSQLVYAQTFTLKSTDLGGQASNVQVFKGFGCEGENISPQLSWENAPAETKSFAITMYDPDAPTGSGWWHWVVFNLPNTISEIPSNAGNPNENLMPLNAVQAITDFGQAGYGGPCPPEGHGLHQYIITVYALKIEKLDLDKNASPALIGYYLNNNVIEKASLVFYHQR